MNATAAAGVLPAGAPVPDVELVDQHGQRLRWSELWEGQHALLVFYPFAFSPTCTRELDELAEDLAAFDAAAVQVAGVSCDPVPALRAFSDARGYPLPLLSDFWPHGAAARAVGVFDGGRGVARRGSLLVDPAGHVRWSALQEDRAGRPAGLHRAALEALPAP
ncbi:peroxiredoxin [Kineococcus xinjiangensis]|uniref:Peroxiredoxin n=1 Tax=Kineococcus xinjiangensis TaxID=512762 RepID=A0A2S6IMM2_9ACTN|nr:redoxin domain-containing protein [Kineococcus xinjiangensis]PPK95390.1 peroxiredoxin [Kineococcus xinjiangensis]